MTDVLRVDPAAPDPAVIAHAAGLLRRGGLVAFPTETVYGLGVHALDAPAVQRLFDAKGRPSTDPLIVHVSSLDRVSELTARVPEAALVLARRFWPGPLTIVLPKSAAVPLGVTAGLDTVAVRIPAHPVAKALLEAADLPVAAPSANLFSRPSPTCADHVLADLRGRIDAVIDAGPTAVGVESTVLDLSGEQPTILRPGAITREMLEAVLGPVAIGSNHHDGGAMRSPGLLSKHYSPRAPLTLYEGRATDALRRLESDARSASAAGQQVGLLLADEDQVEVGSACVSRLGPRDNLEIVATRLYAALRELDASAVDLILATGFDDGGGLSAAIADRMRRAAAGRIIRM
jgi:L-threonylcarbamoyladenylate synthase